MSITKTISYKCPYCGTLKRYAEACKKDSLSYERSMLIECRQPALIQKTHEPEEMEGCGRLYGVQERWELKRTYYRVEKALPDDT